MTNKKNNNKKIKKTKTFIIISCMIIVIFGILTLSILWSNKIYPFTLDKSKMTNVIINTNKTEYDKDEIIKIDIENKSGISIYYDFGGSWSPWYLEYLNNGEWIVGPGYNDGEKYVQTGYYDGVRNTGDSCGIALGNPSLPNKLKSNEKISDSWDQKFCSYITTEYYGSGMPPAVIGSIESGTYRLTFDYGFKSSIFEPSSSSDLTNNQIIYSNSFKIK